jgi:hypothetical protein
VTVLLHRAALEARRPVVGEPLRSLADSLASDLEPVLARELFIPDEKARMTRRGGRCESDGTLLEFDPFSPRAHRCPKCGAVFEDDAHYRWWIMWYQLWLAERSVHGAALYALRGDVRHRDFARAVLSGYADRYPRYPNKDNVLGPTRPFFSTYLESIWLLQLVVALDLLESGSFDDARLGDHVRDRIIEPSAALIRSYDEGLSNRQVWNNAALLAASQALGRRIDATALDGPSGLVAHLTQGLLADGTWYEGENYHLFAHRGLWYGVTIVEAAGVTLEPRLVRRFDEAFATPFVTALPDFTFPSRRDSQYAVSLRQWRFAELAELGLVRQPEDHRLRGALATLYDGTEPRADVGRARSTAEAERNLPATALDRSDLGWRSLLFALPSLPTLESAPPGSALLADQGLAILRRDAGRLYAALDYGHSGAGHGHPDRLNVMLVHGHDRWLDDVGTGSYVDPSLHWYRSTLAHNAPLVDGRSQQRVHGSLVAYEDRGSAGWVRAVAEGVAPGVRLARTIVAMADYVVDELTWEADHDIQLDLPFHADGELEGAGEWIAATPAGGSDSEDGFDFLSDTETAGGGGGGVRLRGRTGASTATAWLFVAVPHAWWRATAFGAPGSGPARFHFVRAQGARGSIRAMWDVLGVVDAVASTDHGLSVVLRDGTRHEHRSDLASWHVDVRLRDATTTMELAGAAEAPQAPQKPRAHVSPLRAPLLIPRLDAGERSGPLTFDLAKPHYRRSEPSWEEAGRPTATVSLAVERGDLVIITRVHKRHPHFAPATSWNPLDNEHPDTNSDGVQLHMIVPPPAGAPSSPRDLNWLIVPEPTTARVRVTARTTANASPSMAASWSPTEDGYSIRCALPLAELGVTSGNPFTLGVIVNDMSADRERRRGQLVLGGASGDFVYLRGDRLAPEGQLEFVIADV